MPRAAAFFVLLLLPFRADAQPAPAPAAYEAVADRAPRREPALPAPGVAGSSFVDPAFGSRIWRVTDGLTRPGLRDRSYRTPSGTHQNAWSASGRYFVVVSTDGTILPFAFDPASGRAERVNGPSGGGLELRFYTEPHFSYVRPDVVYGGASGGSLRTVDQYDFAAGAYTRLLDLDDLVRGLEGTYVGGIGSSGGPAERLLAFFGGPSQDRHAYLVLFDRADPSRRRLLNTKESTLDGRRTETRLDFLLHAAAIDRSGRYVTLYPAAADRSAPRQAAPTYVWDTATDTFTELPSIAARTNGHDAYGYGVRVNQDCCTAGPWDAAQWQFRALADPLATRDLVGSVLAPKQVYLADHPSWHNARPDRLVPFVTALYRYGANDVEWRAWDDEIVAVDTRAATDAAVWRIAHHRSDVRHDEDPGRISFWYTPRPNVSPDGRWVLFTSNWEKTLGRDPAGERGTTARQDVFLVRLEPGAANPDDGSDLGQGAERLVLPAGRVGRLYSARLTADGLTGHAGWRLVSGTLPLGVRLASSGRISGAPRTQGSHSFVVQASEGSVSRLIAVSMIVR
jgi:hypothetical protein